MKTFREFHFFVIGFLIGTGVLLVPLFIFKSERKSISHEKLKEHLSLHEAVYQKSMFDETLSQVLFEKVKILCVVMTYPENHRLKAIHVRDTWGKRCNKLIFVTSELDPELEVVVYPLTESRSNLWNKTQFSFEYLYKHHINDFDWFLKADDDNYLIIENLRYMLSQYNPNTALYFGHRYTLHKSLDEGYMAGGGYILSKKAVKKFAEKLIHTSKCGADEEVEDYAMGHCLAHHAIFVDCRDKLHQKRFFPIGVADHLMPAKEVDPKFWYFRRLYYKQVAQGNLSCCSDTAVEYHYINPPEMYALDYFIYKLHPFGLDDHSTEVLPEKIALDEIIAASDAHKSKRRKNIHYMDSDELY